jgi:hypothetical protein
MSRADDAWKENEEIMDDLQQWITFESLLEAEPLATEIWGLLQGLETAHILIALGLVTRAVAEQQTKVKLLGEEGRNISIKQCTGMVALACANEHVVPTSAVIMRNKHGKTTH